MMTAQGRFTGTFAASQLSTSGTTSSHYCPFALSRTYPSSVKQQPKCYDRLNNIWMVKTKATEAIIKTHYPMIV